MSLLLALTASAGGGITATGIVSGEAFGTPALSANITATGIVSGEAFGSPVVAGGAAIFLPNGQRVTPQFMPHVWHVQPKPCKFDAPFKSTHAVMR